MVNRDGISDLEAQRRCPQWRLLLGRLHLTVKLAGFPEAIGFVNRVAELAEAADHHPEIDVRWNTVQLSLSSHDIGGLSERDVALAGQVVALVGELGGSIDNSSWRQVQIAIDALDIAAVLPFWKAVFGYRQIADDELADPQSTGPSIWFQQLDRPRPGRNRIHLDVYLAADVAEARRDAALAAGGTLVTDAYAPSWWVLADPEGNEACICTDLERDSSAETA